MALKPAKPAALDSDNRTLAALQLLAALTVAPENHLSRSDAIRELGVSDGQLDETIELLQAVSDDRTGARIALVYDGDDIFLQGDAGLLDPLRFTGDEALALTQVLDRFRFSPHVRERIHEALDPRIEQADRNLLEGDPLFGGFYPVLSEALTIGARVEISYRSYEDDKPHARMVDPGFITVEGDAAHLAAWDIAKDAQRTYRLDRIAGVSLTDDSVERHPFERTTLADSLRKTGLRVTVRFASNTLLEQTSWQGLDREHARMGEDGTVLVPLSCTSKPWLFDQLLASGGELVLEEPTELRAELLAYAQTV